MIIFLYFRNYLNNYVEDVILYDGLVHIAFLTDQINKEVLLNSIVLFYDIKNIFY